MRCSDIQMMIASQIAYIDFSRAVIDSGQYTVREALEMELESAGDGKKSTIKYILNLMETEQGRECVNWVIKDVRNDQKISGMYACMLDTGDKGAVIAFRGSEDIKNPDNLVKDWIGSDLGLLNNIQTPQQMVAEKYIRDLYQKYGADYDSYNMTGHSLGGNLAMHTTVTAPDSMREKIDRCLNLDGPGMSQNYLIAHANDIAKSKGCIDHYQWSIVGTLLNTIPGSNYRIIKAETPDDEGWKGVFKRHDTRNVKEYDENGNMVFGEQDWLSEHTKEITTALDWDVLMLSGTLSLAILYNYMDMTLDVIQDIKEKWEKFFRGNRDAEFAVHIVGVLEMLEQIRTETAVLRSVREEVNRIRAELAFQSLSKGFIKYKLWNIENSLGFLEQKIQNYGTKGAECVRMYQMIDARIAQKV